MTRWMILLGVCATMASTPSGAQDTPATTDWAEHYDQMQAVKSYEYLMDCWIRQWPGGVPGNRDDADSWPDQARLDEMMDRTRTHCGLQLEVRRDQIRVDLARGGRSPPDLEQKVEETLDEELGNLLFELYSRD